MDIHNKRNILITKNDIKNIFNMFFINVEPNNIELYRKSLTHKSYAKESDFKFIDILNNNKDFNTNIVPFRKDSNERFELLGDNIISMIVVEYLFNRFPNENEGVLTRLKTIIISCKYFAKFGRILGLDKFILLSNIMENINNGRHLDSIIEDAFESFMCALKLDLGLEYVKKIVIKLIEDNINFTKLLFNNDNYKDRLVKFSQKEKFTVKFINNTVLGPQDKRTYLLDLYINNKKTNLKGFGFSKKDAEQNVSLLWLKKNNRISNEELIIINS